MAKELNELFRVVTSMNIDVEDMIKNTTNKEETFRHLIWHIPNGVKWKNNPELSANVKELMNTLSEKCGVNAEEIYKEDGKLDYREELALSSATVEVVPPAEVTVEYLRTFLQSGEGELKLTNDIEIDSSLIVEADNLVLDLNGHTITNVLRGEEAEIWIFKIEGKPIDGEDGRYEPKTFTVKDSVGTGKVDGGDQLCYVQCCLVSKNGATVNIEGGYWTTGADITGSDRNDCIFVDNANLNITGGKFESTYPWMRGDIPVHFCINTKDANTSNCNVVITGGEFVDMDPSNNLTDSTPITNWVPEGYVSTSRVEGEHTIYTVTKA